MLNTSGNNWSVQALSLLSLVSKRLLRTGDEFFQEIGLSLPQFEIMRILWQRDNLTLSELSRFCCCAPPNVTGLVDRLEKKGWVSRCADPKDRRAMRVVLTDAGQALARPAREVARKLLTTLEEALTPDEVASLARLLEKLYQHLEGGGGCELMAGPTQILPQTADEESGR